jgi:hypothetical protein
MNKKEERWKWFGNQIRWENNDKWVLHCKSTILNNGKIDSALKYDEKITREGFYNETQQQEEP